MEGLMTRTLLAGLVLGCLAAAGVPRVEAQSAAPSNGALPASSALATPGGPDTTRVVGPRDAALRLGITADQPAARPARPHQPIVQDTLALRRDPGPFLLMIVGGTGMLAGLLTDSEALALGSAAIFGLGVYLYID
jgi:hypothetical protein